MINGRDERDLPDPVPSRYPQSVQRMIGARDERHRVDPVVYHLGWCYPRTATGSASDTSGAGGGRTICASDALATAATLDNTTGAGI